MTEETTTNETKSKYTKLKDLTDEQLTKIQNQLEDPRVPMIEIYREANISKTSLDYLKKKMISLGLVEDVPRISRFTDRLIRLSQKQDITQQPTDTPTEEPEPTTEE